MRIIPAESITISPDRQRREFSPQAISDLATSIGSRGLLQPIVLREGNILVAGERRLRALSVLALQSITVTFDSWTIQPGEVPVVDLGDLSPLEAEEAELEENLRRVNLSWQEEERAVDRIHKLRQAKSAGATSREETGVSLFPDLVPEAARLKVSQSIRLTAAMQSDPTIAKAKSRNEAIKLLGKKDDIERRTALSNDASKVSTNDRHLVILGECVEILKAMPDGLFDCIVTDPPYGIGAETFGDAAGRLAGIEHVYVDDRASVCNLFRSVVPELFRVGKAAHHLYLWCDIDLFHWLRQTCSDAGYWVHRTPLINIKREGGRVPWPEHGPRRCYEICLYAVKGKKQTTAIYPDVFESTLSEGNYGHGAQKPVESYINLLRRSCRPGDNVLDCFGGTGTMLEAAEALQLKSTIVENAPHAHGICLERLAKLGEK